ncbi:50S ribosomal protein L1 [Candidatus Parcubacteria bacterium]|nr:50S ribosomal protein L1 [Candidatus Parcubacteria bacterium]
MSIKKEKIKLEFDKTKAYPIKEAIELVKKTSKAKFDASVEVHFRLGIDPKKNDQQVRSTVVLPHSFGKSKKIAAFVLPDQEKEAKDAGAEIVGGEELIKKIKDTKKIDFEIAVATPKMMKLLAQIAKILGPRGLMPSPKNETIAADLKKTISELQKGKIAFKNDDTGNIHQVIGKISNREKNLAENYQIFLDALNKAKSPAAKGDYIKNITICSTMGPGINVEIQK